MIEFFRHQMHRLNGWFLAVLLFVLGAFLWQSCLTQTHLHFRLPPVSTVVAGPSGQPAHFVDRPAPFDTSPVCPICQASETSGHYLAASPVVVFQPERQSYRGAPATVLRSVATRWSHAWLSRAPPPLLL